jgi:hypothetical protein
MDYAMSNLYNDIMRPALADMTREIVDTLSRRLGRASDTVLGSVYRIDTSLSAFRSQLQDVSTTSDLDAAKQDLMYAINTRSGGGGGDPTDLGPVLAGISGLGTDISAARAASTAETRAVGDSVSALRAGIENIDGSLEGVKGAVEQSGRTVDSGGNARWRIDNKYRDSTISANKSDLSDGSGQIGTANTAVATAGGGVGSALSGWRGATCTESPTIQIPYLEGQSIDVTPLFNGMGGTVMAVVRIIELAGGLGLGAFFGLRVALKGAA